MEPTNVIIFSKDRAMQLDALIRSLRAFTPYAEMIPTVVLACSNDDYRRAYLKLMDEHSDFGYMPDEVAGIKDAVLDAIDPTRPLTTFLVDDDVFFDKLPEVAVAPGEAYAPRLGDNCTYCYMRDCPMSPPKHDFDCTLSLDGHIYRTEDILPAVERVSFSTPNQLESELCCGERRAAPFRLRYAEHSCLVGVPHNSVGENKGNRNGGGDPAELNERYLRGYRIALTQMDFSNVIGVHQEIEYKFYKRS